MVGGFRRYGQTSGLAAQERNQLLVYDLDDLLGRRQAFEDLRVRCLFGNSLDEVLCDLEVDVRLEQCHAGFFIVFLDIDSSAFPCSQV